MKLVLGYFYPEELNLYGDVGNVEILIKRAQKRGFETELIDITSKTKLTKNIMDKINLIFMGGGPDSGQKKMYQDLMNNKGLLIKDYIESGGASLFICGSYQLAGKHYKSADGSKLEGLGVFDLYTEHPGHNKQRCVGNTVAFLNDSLINDSLLDKTNHIGPTIVGFENHGGRTYLNTKNKEVRPLAYMVEGFGNNANDKTEGIYYKNSIGTYFHGPFLSKNPHIADFLLAKAMKLENLDKLEDTIIKKAHSALVKRLT